MKIIRTGTLLPVDVLLVHVLHTKLSNQLYSQADIRFMDLNHNYLNKTLGVFVRDQLHQQLRVNVRKLK